MKSFVITDPSEVKKLQDQKFSIRKKDGKVAKSKTDDEKIDRIKVCIDPLMNKDYGCFSPNNTKKFSCFQDVLPDVLECLYLGNTKGSYCVSNSIENTYPCNGECGFTRQQISKIYGCSATHGTVQTCNTDDPNFCKCPDIKKWNNITNSCECPDNTEDNGKCCVSDTMACSKANEYYDCDQAKCICRSGYIRKNNDPLEDCIKYCGKSSQNNPVNFTDPQSGASGCGILQTDPEIGQIGTNNDFCCDENGGIGGVAGMCVKDIGAWDGIGKNISKSQCLLTNGFWKITINNTCHRKGHCEYTSCSTNFVQASEPLKMYTGTCNKKCNENACKTACATFADSRGTKRVNSECFNVGYPPSCLCYTESWV